MLNQLEHEIFNWYQKKYPDTPLDQQIKSAKLVSRIWTKVGFYVEFEVDKQITPFSDSFPISGPEILSEDIDCGGGCLLWGKDGYLNCLEIYANGDFFKEEIETFELVDMESDDQK